MPSIRETKEQLVKQRQKKRRPELPSPPHFQSRPQDEEVSPVLLIVHRSDSWTRVRSTSQRKRQGMRLRRFRRTGKGTGDQTQTLSSSHDQRLLRRLNNSQKANAGHLFLLTHTCTNTHRHTRGRGRDPQPVEDSLSVCVYVVSDFVKDVSWSECEVGGKALHTRVKKKEEKRQAGIM